MKCFNCGHELEPGSGFCENCGMINSLDSDNTAEPASAKTENPSESSYDDVYSSSASFLNNSPESEEDAFDYIDDSTAPAQPEAEQVVVPVEELLHPDGDRLDEQQIVDEVQNSDEAHDLDLDETQDFDEAQGLDEVQAFDGAQNFDDANDINEVTDFSESVDVPDSVREPEVPDAIPLDETQDDASYEAADEFGDISEPEPETEFEPEPEPESVLSAQTEPEQQSEESDEPDENDGLDDMYVTASKTKKNSVIIAVLVVILIAVIAGGISMVSGNFSKPAVGEPSDTTASEQESTSKVQAVIQSTEPDESTTEEATESETEETSDEETSAAAEQTTAQAVTGKSETTSRAETTAAVADTTAAQPSTTKASTTKPTAANTTTTKVATSTTTTTTKPSTTKASTTADPYGFGTAPVQKPESMLAASDRYTVYVNTNSLVLRSQPTTESERVCYLSLGEDLTVYAKSQNGFSYVRSNRFGVYGWVSVNYISTQRPQAESEVTVPGLTQPDKLYDTPKNMYVVPDVGLRLRKGPSTDSATVIILSKGFPVTVKGYSSKDSGWVFVTDTTHGVSGWTRLEWLTTK